MSFQRRLFLSFTLLLLGALVASFASVYLVVRNSEVRELDEALASESREQILEVLVAKRSGTLAPELLLQKAYDPSRVSALLSREAKVLAKDERLGCDLAQAPLHKLGEAFDLACGAQTYRALTRELPESDGLHVLTALSQHGLESDARFMVRTMLVVLILAVVLSALLARSLVQGLTSEVDAIRLVARAVAEGDLHARVKMRRGDRDIARLAGDVDTMIDRLEILVTAQDRFVAHAAHELRSPITALYGELSLALRKDRTKESYLETIEHANQSAKHLKVLAENLLSLVRGAREPVETHADMALAELGLVAWNHVLAARQVDLTQATLEEPACAFRVVGEAYVRGNRNEIERLLRNLLENAHRHAAFGAGVVSPPWVELALSDRTVSVSNSGHAVASEDLERIFEPFYRGAKTRALHPGAGLGLAIAKEIAASHQATLSVDASFKGGARFVLQFQGAEIA
jgi:two-component system, OmpR family, sensor kinase